MAVGRVGDEIEEVLNSLQESQGWSPKSSPSVEKARTVLGWEAQIGVREGVRQTVDWLRSRL